MLRALPLARGDVRSNLSGGDAQQQRQDHGAGHHLADLATAYELMSMPDVSYAFTPFSLTELPAIRGTARARGAGTRARARRRRREERVS